MRGAIDPRVYMTSRNVGRLSQDRDYLIAHIVRPAGSANPSAVGRIGMARPITALKHVLLVAALGATLPSLSGAENGYPARAVRMVVPLPPGITADLMPRIIATCRHRKPARRRPARGGRNGREVSA